MLMPTPATEQQQTVTRPRCFLFQSLAPGFNGSSLNDFGDVVAIFGINDPPPPSVYSGRKLADEIGERLLANHFDVESDFIVISGSMNASAAFTAVVVHEYGYCNALLWSNRDSRYVATELG